MADLQKLVEELSSLTVMEAAELKVNASPALWSLLLDGISPWDGEAL